MANFFSGLFGQKNKPQSADHGAEANQADAASSYIEQIVDDAVRSLKHNEITEDEDTVYAKAFQKSLTDLANDVYGKNEPFDIAQKALQSACDFYEADWCGMFDADMLLDLWMPFWWYNNLTGGMTKTQLKDGRVMGDFEMFRKMIISNTSYYQADIETIKESRPEEYALFSSQDVKSFLSVPYSRREHGVIFLRNPKKFGDRPDYLRIIANILIQEINQQKHLDRMKINAAAADISQDADVIVNLFGGIEVMTEQGKLVETEMKSAVCSKIFVLLMLNRHRGMPAKELSDLIWGDKEFENHVGNLRSHLYRLRNMLDLLSKKDLVITQPNGYRINPELKIHTDFEQFECLCKSVKPMMQLHEQIKILKEAVDLYDGKLFPSAEGEHWHIHHSAYYHTMYLKAVEALMELYHEVTDYRALHDCSMKAIKIEANSPAIIYWLIIALRKNGAIEMAKKHLESAKARLLEEEYRELENRLQIAV